MNSTHRLLVAGAALLFVAACATTPVEETKSAPVADKSATPPAPAPAPAPDSRTVAKAEPAKTRRSIRSRIQQPARKTQHLF